RRGQGSKLRLHGWRERNSVQRGAHTVVKSWTHSVLRRKPQFGGYRDGGPLHECGAFRLYGARADVARRHFRSFWTTDAAARVTAGATPLRVGVVEFVADRAELTLFNSAVRRRPRR